MAAAGLWLVGVALWKGGDQGLIDACDVLFANARLGDQGIVYRKVRATAANQAPRLLGAPVAEDKLETAPRLSIVVLPFENLSGDPEQEYFADGITDDLTMDLSQLPDAFVIARNTAFT